MSQLVRIVLLCILSVSAVAQIHTEKVAPRTDQEHNAWISAALSKMQTIKVGSTRAELTTMFTTEGGLSTTSQRTYVYRQCPYIKVDVTFAALSREEELPTDKIVKVSRPCLAWSVMD